MYCNVTLQPLLQCKINKYYIVWVCLCSVRYPAVNARASYCQLPMRLYRNLHELINGKIFERKKVSEHRMRVLIFSTTLVWNICHCKKNRTRYDQKCTLVFIWSTRYSCPILMKRGFSPRIFEKYSYRISWKAVQREQSCSMRTDRHDEANSSFSQFCERA